MSTRFPPIPLSSQSTSQREATAQAETIVTQTFGPTFQLKDDNGTLLGPFSLLAYTPSTFAPYLSYNYAIATLPDLTPRERELAVLATASVTKAEYIIYAHSKIAGSVGLAEEVITEVLKGDVPKELEARERVVCKIALDAVKNFGRLEGNVFEKGVEAVGREGVAGIIQIVGTYLLASTLVSAADVSVPGEEKK
ncbi:hypothetical protein BS50DRAFT_570661 [Corynespora cassiicola Philippines]|uniref:Carboxymuconolactone decarboxylase-like domain-containing protein n=1 Tax=Corynespora cassiicola Philippines TaxID=1448308 RepID=A0A2T2P0W6_CORCC|nr:hypothetical protein BS50DRAFT_570661 [Corynespora cassiicola Philippines]